MSWDPVVSKVKPYLVKIRTPEGYGTGFLCFYNHDKSWFGIATALHVVQSADDWQQPIRLICDSGGECLLTSTQRIIIINRDTDSAVILFQKSFAPSLLFPDKPIPLRPVDKLLDIGSEIGWLGYPYLEADKLCFFSGCISARNEQRKYYLIDGVSINGVSGGPVLYSSETDGVEIVGIISAYMANQTSGVTPGLSIAQDVAHFHEVIKKINTIDDAEKAKRESASNPENKASDTILQPAERPVQQASPEVSSSSTNK